MRFIGVDLHKSNFYCCYLTEKGKEFKRYNLVDISRFKHSLCKTDKLAVESTGNSRWFVGQIKSFVAEVVVVNPKQFKVISSSTQKNDKEDSVLLALFLSKGMLPRVQMKDELTSQIQSLCHTRDKLIKLRTTLKNKIHNISMRIRMPHDDFILLQKSNHSVC